MSQRSDRVAEAIRREVGDLLLHGIKDERVREGLASVTDVEVSGDLRHAKVFVSVYGTEEEAALAMEGLTSAAGYMRGVVGRRLGIRHAPELHFELDRSLARGSRVIALLNSLKDGEGPSD